MNKEKALKNQGLEFREDMCFYGEDRKPYSVSMASMDTMGMSMFSP